MYKIGSHTGTQEKLLSRYSTSLIEPRIECIYVSEKYRKLEKDIHKALDQYRVKTSQGKQREWFLCSLDTIKNVIDQITNEDTYWFFFNKEWQRLTILEICQRTSCDINIVNSTRFQQKYMLSGDKQKPTLPPDNIFEQDYYSQNEIQEMRNEIRQLNKELDAMKLLLPQYLSTNNGHHADNSTITKSNINIFLDRYSVEFITGEFIDSDIIYNKYTEWCLSNNVLVPIAKSWFVRKSMGRVLVDSSTKKTARWMLIK